MRTYRFAPSARAAAVLWWVAFGLASPARAQLESFLGNAAESPISVRAVIAAPVGSQPAKLVVTADLQPGWNTYSITQPAGGQIRTQIKITPSPQFAVGPFQPIEKPILHPEPAFGPSFIAEEHRGSVTWVAALQPAAGVDLATLDISGSLYAQACNNVCMPPANLTFVAKLGPVAVKLPDLAPVAAQIASPPPAPPSSQSASNLPPPPLGRAYSPPGLTALPPVPSSVANLNSSPSGVDPAAIKIGTFQPQLSHLTWNGRIKPSAVAPGGKAKLLFTATMAPLWHVYQVDEPQTFGNQPTLFVMDETAGFQVAKAQPNRQPTPPHGTPVVAGSRLIPYFEKEVTWALEVDVPATTVHGEYKLAGAIGFQTCDEKSQCDRPGSVRFETTLLVSPTAAAASPTPVRFIDDSQVSYNRIKARVLGDASTPPVAVAVGSAAPPTTGYDIAQINVQSAEGPSSLPVMLGIGLLAGFILNFMPCVLPVIGLKVLSFVEQGGHDRRRVFLLNLWYSLGILSVFWILATIPVVLSVFFGTTFGWGQQFSYDGFNITLVAIVFVMALSFLGVWEIPIPGFAGAGSAQKAASKEGAIGAFVKGMITTVLATPCSGPFLGTAVAFAFTATPVITYAMFTAMGLGMAAPYLLIGLRPELVKVLPRPGEWMDTFKQLMGFVLIGTVLWLMLPIDAALLMPTLVMLAGLSAACWWIGRTPGYAELPTKLKAWAQATAFAGLIGWLAFAMPQVTDPLPWKHFAMAEFVREVNAGKTVLVEFTADWCATCKTLKAANLDRSKTKARVAANGVLVYEMNIDSASDEEKAFFRRMQPAGSVPLVAIFPAGKKYEPIRFGDGYTQTQILTALDEAGPSAKTETDVADRDGAKSTVH